MARLIPASERILRARALIQKARDVPQPADSVVGLMGSNVATN